MSSGNGLNREAGILEGVVIRYTSQRCNNYLCTKRRNFRPIQFESVCRRQNKCCSRSRICPIWDENIVGKGENAGVSQTFFKILMFQGRKNQGLFGNVIFMFIIQVLYLLERMYQKS